MYQIIEQAGSDNERVVAEFKTWLEAFTYKKETYGNDDEGVDIIKNGSTEF